MGEPDADALAADRRHLLVTSSTNASRFSTDPPQASLRHSSAG
jgi:hypothetical protein